MRIPSVLRLLLAAAVTVWLAGCSHHHLRPDEAEKIDNPFKAIEDQDAKKLLTERELRQQADQLYRHAREALESGDYDSAITRYDQLIARYPFSDFSTQSEMEKVFALYKGNKSDEALSAADRFLRAHPRHPHADYVQYLKGLTDFDRDRGLANMVSSSNSKRDVSGLRRAFEDFALLMQKYPNSRYAGDARRRMLYARNRVADHELSIARFYYAKREAYVAAAKRAADILADFPGAPATADALDILQHSYTKLGLQQQAQDASMLASINPEKLQYPGAPAAILTANAEPPPVPPPATDSQAAGQSQGGLLHGVSTTLGSGLAAVFHAVGIGSSDKAAPAAAPTASAAAPANPPAAADTTAAGSANTAPAGAAAAGTVAAASDSNNGKNTTAAAPPQGGNPLSRLFNGLTDKLLAPGTPPPQYKPTPLPKSRPATAPVDASAAAAAPEAAAPASGAAASAPTPAVATAAAPAAGAATDPGQTADKPAAAAVPEQAQTPQQSPGLMSRFTHLFNVFDTSKPENQHVIVLPSGNSAAAAPAAGGSNAAPAAAGGATALHLSSGYQDAQPAPADAPAAPTTPAADVAQATPAPVAAPKPAAVDPPASPAVSTAPATAAPPAAAAAPAAPATPATKSGGFFTWFVNLFSFADPDKHKSAPASGSGSQKDSGGS